MPDQVIYLMPIEGIGKVWDVGKRLAERQRSDLKHL